MKDSKDTEWTDEALRIAIAKACGWERCSYPEFVGRGANRHKHAMFGCNSLPLLSMHKPGWGGKNYYGPESSPPPNYPSDLNACHEMIGRLTEDQLYTFVENLTLKKWSEAWIFNDIWQLLRADARTLCLAFVNTLGLSPEKKD